MNQRSPPLQVRLTLRDTIRCNDIMLTNVFVLMCIYEYKRGANYPVFAYILCIYCELSLRSVCHSDYVHVHSRYY